MVVHKNTCICMVKPIQYFHIILSIKLEGSYEYKKEDN